MGSLHRSRPPHLYRETSDPELLGWLTNDGCSWVQLSEVVFDGLLNLNISCSEHVRVSHSYLNLCETEMSNKNGTFLYSCEICTLANCMDNFVNTLY